MSIVETETVLHHVVPCGATVRATFRYDPADPYAVHITFHDHGDEPNVWTFARQLLIDSLDSTAGDGCVRLWPSTSAIDNSIFLQLSGVPADQPHAQADQTLLLRIPRPDLCTFLSATLLLVPADREHVDWDSVIAAVLQEADT